MIPLKKEARVRFGTPTADICRFRLLVAPGYTFAWYLVRRKTRMYFRFLLNEGPVQEVLEGFLEDLLNSQNRLGHQAKVQV